MDNNDEKDERKRERESSAAPATGRRGDWKEICLCVCGCGCCREREGEGGREGDEAKTTREEKRLTVCRLSAR